MSASISRSMRSMAASILASWSSVDIVGCKIRDVAISSYRETGEDGVVNSGDRVSKDVLLTVVPWHGRTTLLCALGLEREFPKVLILCA